MVNVLKHGIIMAHDQKYYYIWIHMSIILLYHGTARNTVTLQWYMLKSMVFLWYFVNFHGTE